MYRFLFRKTVFGGWDHILGLFLANIGYLILLAAGALWWFLYVSDRLALPLLFLLIAVTVLISSCYTMGIAGYTANIGSGAAKGRALEGTVSAVRSHVPHVMMYAFITLVIIIELLFAFPFYMSMGGFMGPLMAFISLFLTVFLITGFKYYLPLCYLRPEEGVVGAVKYSFAYALDNKGITLFLLFITALCLLISVPFVGIIPGFTGILLTDTCMADLLNRRYVLAGERGVEKEAVPWDDVLDTMDRDRYEKRKFLSLLFPGR